MRPTSRRFSTNLLQKLENLLKECASLRSRSPLRIAVLGVGNELRGDDAAGLHVVRLLQPLVADLPGILVLDGGPAPENFTGVLRRFSPDLVLLVDAAEMEALPGVLRFLPWQETVGLGSSTHSLPPYMLASYLVHELGCQVALIGIQTRDNTFGAPISPVISRAVDRTVQTLAVFLTASNWLARIV